MAEPIKGTKDNNFTTPLPADQQKKYDAWKAQYAPKDSGDDYDLQGAFLAGMKPDVKSGHFPDQFKKPNHPSFSTESQYAADAPEKAGSWNGEVYVPKEAPPKPILAPSEKEAVVSRDKSIKFKPTLDPKSADLYDMKTGQRVVATDMSDLQAGIANGRYGYGKNKVVHAYDPDGNLVNMDANLVQWSLNNGYQLESPEKAAIREKVEAAKGIQGSATTFLKRFGNEALLGIPDIIGEHSMNPEDIAASEAIQNDHKIASVLGTVAGVVASTEIGAPLFKGAAILGRGAEALVTGERAIEGAKALEIGTNLARAGMPVKEAIQVAPGLARTVLGKAVGLGVEGGVISAPQTLSEAALGDTDAAVESLTHGIGLGAAFGLAGGVFKGVAGKLPNLAGLAEDRAFMTLNPNGKILEMAKETPGGNKAIGRAMMDNDLMKRVGEDFASYETRIQNARSSVGDNIGNLYTKLDSIGPSGLRTASELAEEARNNVIKPLAKELGKKGIASKVESVVQELESLGGKEPMSFSQLHDYRKQLDDLIYREGQIGVTDKASQQLVKFRDILSKELETKGDRLAQKANFDFINQLNENNVLYRQLKVVSKAAENGATAELAPRGTNAGDMAVSLASTLGELSHPLGIVKGLIAGRVHKFIRQEGNGISANVLNYISGLNKQRGLLLAEEANNRTAKKLGQIPKILSAAASFGKERGPQIAIAGALTVAHHEKLNDHMAELLANPDELNKAAKVLSADIANNGAPTIGKGYEQKQLSMIRYMQNEMPKPSLPPNPYVRSTEKPTSDQLRAYAEKLAVLDDPFVVWNHIQNGTLTENHMHSLDANWPRTKNAMVARVKEHQVSPFAKPLPYSIRQGLEQLTGENYTGQKSNQSFFQQLHQGEPKATKPAANNKLQDLPSFQTAAGAMSDGAAQKRKRR